MVRRQPPRESFRVYRQGGEWCVSGSESARLGSQPVAECDRSPGPFAGWDWNPAARMLVAGCDPLGFHPLFYCRVGDGVAVASSPFQLVADRCAPADLDHEALAVFFSIGWFLGEDTPFAAIKVLPPGGKLIWADGRLSTYGCRPQWERSTTGRAAAVDGFIRKFRASVALGIDSCPGEIVVPLSGGRDSRHIVMEMAHLGRKPDRCVTYSHGGASRHDSDAVGAAAVAKALGLKHEVIDARSSPMRDRLRAVVLTHGCSDEHAQCLPLRDFLPPSCSAFDGIVGDVLSRNKGFSQPEAHKLCLDGDWGAVADRWLLESYDRIFKSTYEERVGLDPKLMAAKGRAREAIIESLRSFADAADPYSAFTFWTRTRREISLIPAAVHAGLDQVCCPYLNLDLVNFLGSLPFEVTADGKFHDAVIEAAFPQHRSIPYEFKPAPGGRGKLRAVADRLWWARDLAETVPFTVWAAEVLEEARAHVPGSAKSTRFSRSYLRLLGLASDGPGAARVLAGLGR